MLRATLRTRRQCSQACRMAALLPSSSSMELQTPVQYIKGIGPRRFEDLSSRNIFTAEDLLYNLPYRYEDRSRFKQVKELQPGERTSILVEVLTSGLVITRR